MSPWTQRFDPALTEGAALGRIMYLTTSAAPAPEEGARLCALRLVALWALGDSRDQRDEPIELGDSTW